MMKAIGYTKAGQEALDHALVDLETDSPEPRARDLVVEVRGVSVNPVDVKVRRNVEPDGHARILGFDAAGVVKEVGSQVTLFAPGDEVFYSGDVTRSGTNAELHAVDERIVGKKPTSLGFAEAAGMPLTSITAWELLFDSFGLAEGDGSGESILVIGGAGGVGSILIQLAKKLTALTVVATASRAETKEWVVQMGADHVVDHRKPLDQEMRSLGVSPRYVASLTNTDQHYASIVELIQPRGLVGLIDDPQSLDVLALKRKAVSLCWEFMFARPMFNTPDITEQHVLLDRVSELLDGGELVSTVNHHAGALSVPNLQRAHELQASGRTIGKTVLDGFGAA